MKLGVSRLCPGGSLSRCSMTETSADDGLTKLKRTFDCVLASILVAGLSPLLAVVAIAVKLTSKGSILHWSDRVGKNNTSFRMPKFRTMRMDTPQLATHLLSDPSAYLTPIGRFLRCTSLDELPQLFSVLAGHLSLVGPRPALFNQQDLVELRTERGIHRLTPGITGWAQVNGRDELPIPIKVNLDCEYLRRRSFGFDLIILAITALKVVRREGVSH
jgi:O-antigen biosynthesis protein WbqP